MPELTPDPVYDKLVRFTPSAAGLDLGEIMFRAGVASARTPRFWKAVAAGLGIALGVLLGERFLNQRNDSEEAAPVVLVIPVPVFTPEPAATPNDSETESPWRLGALLHAADANDLPHLAEAIELLPADPPLTPRSRSLD